MRPFMAEHSNKSRQSIGRLRLIKSSAVKSRFGFCRPQCVSFREVSNSRWTFRFNALSRPIRAHHGRAVELDGGLILRRRSYIFVTYKPSRSSDLLVIISAREVESRYRCEPGGGFLLFLAGSDGGF